MQLKLVILTAFYTKKNRNVFGDRTLCSKTDNSFVYIYIFEDICDNSNEARYEVRLPFKDDHHVNNMETAKCKIYRLCRVLFGVS